MDATTLRSAMGENITPERADQLIDGCNQAMLLAGCTTVNRAAMFLAQVREESVGLMYTQEIGDDAPDQWQQDPYLKGQDYFPYVGRTFIQVTWESNYRSLGSWLKLKGVLADGDTFVNDPATLAEAQWAWHGPAWFWSSHSGINDAADNGDVEGATRIINGAELHGLETRVAYWNHIQPLGEALLPTGVTMNYIHPGLLRAIVLGGKYATDRLKAKYGSMVRDHGLLDRVDNHADEIAKLKDKIAALETTATTQHAKTS